MAIFRLYFSHEKIIPPIIHPKIAKKIPQIIKAYVNGIAHRGNEYRTLTLSARPLISQDRMPTTKNTPATIPIFL